VSPVALPAPIGELRVPLRWAIAAVVLSCSAYAGVIWQGSAAYARIGTLETTVTKNEKLIEDLQRSGERLARLEAVQSLQTEMLKRIDGKLDRR
jgi:uncharacterized coiled-coil protein SlyX